MSEGLSLFWAFLFLTNMNILLEANSIVNDRKEEKEIMEILLNAGYKKSSANWYINKYKSNESN